MREDVGCLLIFFIIIFFIFGEILVLQYLWNWLAPLFWQSAPILTFWQTFGIIMLFNIIGSMLKRIIK